MKPSNLLLIVTLSVFDALSYSAEMLPDQFSVPTDNLKPVDQMTLEEVVASSPLLKVIPRRREAPDQLVTSSAAQLEVESTIESARRDLEAMYESDQRLRLEIMELEREYGSTSKQVMAAWSQQTAIDQKNILRLEYIIAQHGWPGRTKFGATAAAAAFLILQHSDIRYQKKYLELARAAAAIGEMRASSLALLEDRILIREGKRQVYGSQVIRNASQEWTPLPLEDEANVDARRGSVGLGPILEYLQGFADRSGGTVSPKWSKK